MMKRTAWNIEEIQANALSAFVLKYSPKNLINRDKINQAIGALDILNSLEFIDKLNYQVLMQLMNHILTQVKERKNNDD